MQKNATKVAAAEPINGHAPMIGQLLAKLHELAGQAGRNVLERLRTVTLVLEDRAYIADTYKDESQALDALEELYFGDLAGARGLAGLLAMYRACPDEQTWKECRWNLTILLGKYDKEHPGTKQPKAARDVVRKAEHEAVKQELAEQKYHRRQEQDELTVLRRRVAQLEVENAELRGQLKEARQQGMVGAA